MIQKIAIVGQGNVGWHLSRMLKDKFELYEVNSRTIDNFPDQCDLCIICVKDDSISEVANKIPKFGGILVHTSGSKSIELLEGVADRYGVFYPLQTFTKGKALNYSEIPFFLEGSDDEVLNQLKSVASVVSDKIYEANSDRRRRLHIASVFACNYVNHLWKIADDILCEDGISLDVLHPLIEETVNKIKHFRPSDAQTGPAVREDIAVLDAHINFLSNNLPLRDIYTLLAKSIINSKK